MRLVPRSELHRRALRRAAVAVGAGAALAGLALVALPSASVAAPAQAPANTGEPAISGTPVEGRILSTSTGTWTGSQSMTFAYRWVRCGQNGGPAGRLELCSHLGRDRSGIRGPPRRRRLPSSRPRHRDEQLRLRDGGLERDGDRRRPQAAERHVAGRLGLGGRRRDAPGEPGNLDRRAADDVRLPVAPLQHLRGRLRRDRQRELEHVPGALERRREDAARSGRREERRRLARVATSGRTGVAKPAGPSGVITLPNGDRSIPVTSVPSNQRLVVAQIVFSPSTVRSRVDPITIRIRVLDTRGYVVRDALVFIRATPLVTSTPDRQLTAVDGWVTYQLLPNATFPTPRSGNHVQFFIKAYRNGDPVLAGVAGYRLVQVSLAG